MTKIEIVYNNWCNIKFTTLRLTNLACSDGVCRSFEKILDIFWLVSHRSVYLPCSNDRQDLSLSKTKIICFLSLKVFESFILPHLFKNNSISFMVALLYMLNSSTNKRASSYFSYYIICTTEPPVIGNRR